MATVSVRDVIVIVILGIDGVTAVAMTYFLAYGILVDVVDVMLENMAFVLLLGEDNAIMVAVI